MAGFWSQNQHNPIIPTLVNDNHISDDFVKLFRQPLSLVKLFYIIGCVNYVGVVIVGRQRRRLAEDPFHVGLSRFPYAGVRGKCWFARTDVCHHQNTPVDWPPWK